MDILAGFCAVENFRRCVYEIDGAVHFHKAVIQVCIFRLEVIVGHRLGAVELGALEFKAGIQNFAARIPCRGGRAVIHVVAVDVYTRVVVAGIHYEGNHRLHIGIVARGEIFERDAHERTLYDVAVRVAVCRVALYAVDEINPVPCLYRKAAVGYDFVVFIAAVEGSSTVIVAAARCGKSKTAGKYCRGGASKRPFYVFTHFLPQYCNQSVAVLNNNK